MVVWATARFSPTDMAKLEPVNTPEALEITWLEDDSVLEAVTVAAKSRKQCAEELTSACAVALAAALDSIEAADEHTAEAVMPVAETKMTPPELAVKRASACNEAVAKATLDPRATTEPKAATLATA
tara:strand:- start:241 stop:621 length:381 start_codon:yes stop_codon:yes gene_type:complete